MSWDNIDHIIGEIGPRLDETVCDYCGGPLPTEPTKFELPYGQPALVVCADTVCQGAAKLKSREAWAFADMRDKIASGEITLVPGPPER
jgi:hypothetical protein